MPAIEGSIPEDESATWLPRIRQAAGAQITQFCAPNPPFLVGGDGIFVVFQFLAVLSF